MPFHRIAAPTTLAERRADPRSEQASGHGLLRADGVYAQRGCHQPPYAGVATWRERWPYAPDRPTRPCCCGGRSGWFGASESLLDGVEGHQLVVREALQGLDEGAQEAAGRGCPHESGQQIDGKDGDRPEDSPSRTMTLIVGCFLRRLAR